jgi:4-hydroxy-4-methyl-2-oxoglutarate aldolase
MFGDLIGLACQRKGLAGAVTDSGCRDVGEMDAIGFPVFAKGTVLYGPGDVIRPVAADVPVVCGGVDVHPGDVIVADVDGVIVVPKAAVRDVARAKEDLLAKEADVRRKIESGETLAAAYSL